MIKHVPCQIRKYNKNNTLLKRRTFRARQKQDRSASRGGKNFRVEGALETFR